MLRSLDRGFGPRDPLSDDGMRPYCDVRDVDPSEADFMTQWESDVTSLG